MIPVNKPYLPAFDKYTKYLERVYQNGWLTNNGPLVQELKVRLEEYLGVKNLLLVANGTLAMQLAYKVFNLRGNAVTTPFTFIATSSSLAWEGIQPKFADIDSQTFNLCPKQAEAAIDDNTTAIVPVHVYGNPCDVEAFEAIGQRRNVKVIYDAAHAFGVKYKGQSVLNFGDASTLSFHATKVFHSVEGGAVIFKNPEDYERALLMTNFGIDTKTMNIVEQGINTKMSEFHAAMGLAVLDEIDSIIRHRVELFEIYTSKLRNIVRMPTWDAHSTLNGAYMPVMLDDCQTRVKVLDGLKSANVVARRYFSPSLNHLDMYRNENSLECKVSSDAAGVALCLPLYSELNNDEVHYICEQVIRILSDYKSKA